MSSIQTEGRSQPSGIDLSAFVGSGVQQTADGGIAAEGLDQALAALLSQAGFGVTETGSLVVRDTVAVDRTGAVQGTSAQALTGGGEPRLAPVSPPRVELDAEAKEGAESFATNLDLVLNDLLGAGGATGTAADAGAGTTAVSGGGPTTAYQDQLRKLSELSAEQLLAAFLKLNITDPNNSVETHDALQQLSSNLRHSAIEAERKQQEAAAKAAREAQAYASKLGIISKIVMVVLIIVAVVASVFTAGASLAAVAAALPAFASFCVANQALALAICAIVTLIAMVTKAAAEKTYADKAIDAEEKGLDAKMSEKIAEQFQKQIEEENAIVKLIMESKNQTVEAVLKMMNAMFSTANKLMAAQMAR